MMIAHCKNKKSYLDFRINQVDQLLTFLHTFFRCKNALSLINIHPALANENIKITSLITIYVLTTLYELHILNVLFLVTILLKYRY